MEAVYQRFQMTLAGSITSGIEAKPVVNWHKTETNSPSPQILIRDAAILTLPRGRNGERSTRPFFSYSDSEYSGDQAQAKRTESEHPHVNSEPSFRRRDAWISHPAPDFTSLEFELQMNLVLLAYLVQRIVEVCVSKSPGFAPRKIVICIWGLSCRLRTIA